MLFYQIAKQEDIEKVNYYLLDNPLTFNIAFSEITHYFRGFGLKENSQEMLEILYHMSDIYGKMNEKATAIEREMILGREKILEENKEDEPR